MCIRKFGPIDVALEPRQRLGHASAMDQLPPPLAFFRLLFSGWVNRQQPAVIDYLAGARRATGPAALCPVATRREAGGWIVGAV